MKTNLLSIEHGKPSLALDSSVNKRTAFNSPLLLFHVTYLNKIIEQLQGQLTLLNEEVERLTNDNRQLSGSLVTQNDQATSDLAKKDVEIQRILHLLRTTENDRDGQLKVSRQRVTDLEAEIKRISQ